MKMRATPYETYHEEDYDYPEFLRYRTVKSARKQHECCYCHKPIKVGKPYEVVIYKIDGVFKADKCHTRFGFCHEHSASCYNDYDQLICGEDVL